MKIVPPNVATINEAIKQLLVTSLDVGQRGVVVERGEPPEDSQLGPNGWVGIYAKDITYEPRILGIGSGQRRFALTVWLLARASNLHSGQACEDKLEDLVQRVLGVLLTDATFGGHVNMIVSNRVSYADYDKDGEAFTQTALIALTGEGDTTYID